MNNVTNKIAQSRGDGTPEAPNPLDPVLGGKDGEGPLAPRRNARIRIVRCPIPTYWYASEIGREYDAEIADDNAIIEDAARIRFVSRDDFEIVPSHDFRVEVKCPSENVTLLEFYQGSAILGVEEFSESNAWGIAERIESVITAALQSTLSRRPING